MDWAKREWQCEFQDSLLLSLADHLDFAIARHQQGIEVPNHPLHLEVKRIYP
ncbi:PRD domain-containing protein [Vagococcus zengguangii]|uniref:PRD domain-containing protein n=1 Tax=Vagococcus zengguangii TaxID=2571750 RepID=UPI0024821425|nr:PRD domain-containing protein [Vagococcus zengguangii]